MPYRHIPIVPGETYHVFNRSVAYQPIFFSASDYQRYLGLIDYYRFRNHTFRYAHYKRLPIQEKKDYLTRVYQSNKTHVDIYAFCVMPNHFHLLLKQKTDNGISRVMSNVQNGYAKYLNIKSNRSGSVFQSMFKCLRVETDDQLLHVARYIHLNPLTSYIMKEPGQLAKYPWTSFMDYVSKKPRVFVNTKPILSRYRSKKELQRFTFDQVDYQRELDKIKHLAIE